MAERPGTLLGFSVMRRRRRKRMVAPEALEQVLARAGEDRFAPNRAPLPPHVWAAAVGARIAERTRPLAIENGVLIVRAATSVWASELSLLSDALIARLHRAGVNVRALRFRVGPVEPPERTIEIRTAKVPRPTELDPRVARTIARVKDDDLRETIAEAARTNLAWQAFNVPEIPVANATPRAARAPRDAETESAPPDRTTRASRGAARGTREDD
jgi:hypothetical protein